MSLHDHIVIAGISPFLIGNTYIDSIRVHFPASYVRLPECEFHISNAQSCSLLDPWPPGASGKPVTIGVAGADN